MQKINVELTVEQTVFLARFFNTSPASAEEIRATNQYKHSIGERDYDYSVLGSAPYPKLENFTINRIGVDYSPFKKALKNIGVDFESYRPAPSIKVGENTVEFKEGGIQVGCTFVPNETIKEIAKQQKLI